MSEWKAMLGELCDNSADLVIEGGSVFFSRHGREYLLELKMIPGSGACIVSVNDKTFNDSPIPIDRFVQQELLELPRLARQFQKTLIAAKEFRPKVYVDGPSEFKHGKSEVQWGKTQHELENFLVESEVGATRIIQLMAAAGKGKTVLLEELAASCARSYQPEAYPRPLVLVVDLLGRYVGNIDDAIAGALNNTYLFPSLTQRDVVFCVKRQWMILALDGFDELVARVGARDAFLRISDLVDQLGGAGTIILSARESFFDLYQITASIRTYLQPKTGAYSTSIVALRPWNRSQGIEVFRELGSRDPDGDIDGLLTAFDNDTALVLQPFFLTRLADFWLKGDRFLNAKGGSSTLSRTRFVIDTFINREANKWKDRDGNLILTEVQHCALLASVAEEMWRSGAFRLTIDELRAATEICLMQQETPSDRVKLVLERIPTHGALATKDRRYAFIHDRFLGYFLATRITASIADHDATTLTALLSSKELAPNVIEWIVWNCREQGLSIEKSVEFLVHLKSNLPEAAAETNISGLCIGLLGGYESTREVLLSKLAFVGNVFSGEKFYYVTFSDCSFWTIDFTDAELKNCRFVRCKFGEILINAKTFFPETQFDPDTTILAIEISGEGSYFAPAQIEKKLTQAGAQFPVKSGQSNSIKPRVSEEASFIVERFVRASERTTDVAVDEMEEVYGDTANKIAKIGLQTKILKRVEKQTKGANKKFVRFQVDKDRLLRSQLTPIGETSIDGFWQEVSKRFPHK